MKLLVCGRRDLDEGLTLQAIEAIVTSYNWGVSSIIEGGQLGADRAARKWAVSKMVTWQTFNANWDKYGRAAGPIRNDMMLEDGAPDMVLAFWDGKSKGTGDMVSKTLGKVPTLVVPVEGLVYDEREYCDDGEMV